MAVVLLHHHHNHHRRRRLPTLFLFAVVLLLASAIAARPTPIKETQLPTGGEERVVTRRRLSGPGSSPPTCRSKCGSCTPCTAVHVPIHPGLSLPLEYYPEAWRCKCGNSLYMP
ncbi:EPIDERMAL PATTERNING FACTOR-like protein 5 [Cucurbita maxima]|uniref:Epidermal patterning factor-like protein n=1 Tax=Cucurbita maxima TaxID=3661 RepID=A0A6J1KG67_CUCMA|nr:EPIDERMAL PATTERNING FACTOR-like protein 5 [Cucurbita maxima]